MRADEYLKKHGLEDEKNNDDLKDNSLKGKALERATHPDAPRAGSPHDWQDWEKFQASEKQRKEADADK